MWRGLWCAALLAGCTTGVVRVDGVDFAVRLTGDRGAAQVSTLQGQPRVTARMIQAAAMRATGCVARFDQQVLMGLDGFDPRAAFALQGPVVVDLVCEPSSVPPTATRGAADRVMMGLLDGVGDRRVIHR